MPNQKKEMIFVLNTIKSVIYEKYYLRKEWGMCVISTEKAGKYSPLFQSISAFSASSTLV